MCVVGWGVVIGDNYEGGVAAVAGWSLFRPVESNAECLNSLRISAALWGL